MGLEVAHERYESPGLGLPWLGDNPQPGTLCTQGMKAPVSAKQQSLLESAAMATQRGFPEMDVLASSPVEGGHKEDHVFALGNWDGF